MRQNALGVAALSALLSTWLVACSGDTASFGSSEQAQTIAADAGPGSGVTIDLEGIDLSDAGCDCAASSLKNLHSKLREAEALLTTAKNSVDATQGYLDELHGKIEAERAALNEAVASDVALYQGIVVDSVALALDVSVPGSALVRRAACVAGKKMANQMVKSTLATVVKRTTFDNPVKSGLRRVAIARVVEANANGPLEVMTWIPVIGPAVEIFDKFKGLRKRDELMALRKTNLDSLIADYDAHVVMQKGLLTEVEQRTADVANWKSKINSYNTSEALCEFFAGEPEVLGELGIDPNWPQEWANVFFVKTEPKPLKCESAWIKFTGSSRLSRFWGSRDAINAAKAHAESMCFINPVGHLPNPTCDAGYSQQRTAAFDMPGDQNPSGDRHGAGCGEPRLHGYSTWGSDPLTEVDCWCYRTTCCGQGAGSGSGAMAVAD